MKIMLFSHLTQIHEYAAYINAFKKVASVESLFLTMGQEEYKLAQEVSAFDVVKDILPEQSEIDATDTGLSGAAQSLKELEDRIGSCFVNRDILMDRYFRGQRRLDVDLKTVPLIWTGPRTKQFMCLIYKRLDEEIASFDPDFIFVETNYAPGRMVWRLAHEKGIPAGVFWPARYWPERVYLETGLGHDWHQARIAYSEMPDKPIMGEELTKVKQRLQTIRHEKEKPAHMKSEQAKGAPDLFKRLSTMRLFAGFSDWLGMRARTYKRNPRVLPAEIYSPIAKYARYRNGLKAKRYLLKYQTPFRKIQANKYAIYFLHMQPELTVEEMAFDYQDQVNTIRNILASLPADMSLVVKEHSYMLGFRPLEVYAKLVHMPGIIIADAHEDSHKLVTQASVVVTLTGTVGLEAVLYGIPVIVLGAVFFDCFKGTYKPENLYELNKLLSNPEMLQGATEEGALHALGSMLRASAPGRAARIERRVEEIDYETAKWMLSELSMANDECRKQRMG